MGQLAVGPVLAQAVGGAAGGLEQKRPSQELPKLPEFKGPRGVLPALPPVPPEERRGPLSGVRIFVREFRLAGNTVFSDAELGKIAAPFENRYVGNEDLDELRQQLTRYYIDHGYINSGAVIPDQKVENGVIRIDIVEGRLGKIEIQGNERLRSKYLTERIALGTHPPLNINQLRERLQILLQDPAIRGISANLRPGDHPGEADLVVNVKEPPLVAMSATVDNHLSPSLGSLEGRLFGTWQDPFGWGDSLNAEGDFAAGLKDVSGSYSVPVSKWDTQLTFKAEKTDSNVVASPFDVLDIRSEYWSMGAGISQPVYRTPSEQVTLSLGFERRESQTFIFGDTPFAFSPGVSPDGRSEVSVIRFTQDWLRRTTSRVLAARSTISFGVDVLGPTINSGNVPDGRFVSWLGQFQWAQRLNEERGDQLLVRGVIQLASDPLLPMEQFAVGGVDSVRGYRENQLVRDRGFDASVEYRIPVLRNLFQDSAGRPTLQFAAFADVGGAWFIDRETPTPRVIASIGPGLRWDPLPKAHAELYWGYHLSHVENLGSDIQDSGIHFLVGIGF